MKKWTCFLDGHRYDPARDQLPAELRGAAVCRWVEDHEHGFRPRRNHRRSNPALRNLLTETAQFPTAVKPCGCRSACRCAENI
ncbi:MAG: hypothetical protein M0Z41_15555 [Peptococcaceae bacterium]|jgi:hypothetical protein|nr:hypothetical protein [Peptococcaceae bacterium]